MLHISVLRPFSLNFFVRARKKKLQNRSTTTSFPWSALLTTMLWLLTNEQKRKKTDIHSCLVPLDCSRISVTLGIFCRKRYFLSLLLFSVILLVKSFFETFFNVFTCSKQNNGENILHISESLVTMTYDQLS